MPTASGEDSRLVTCSDQQDTGDMSGSIQDLLTVAELRAWLLERVADDDDIVIDDLQEDYNEQFEQEDERNGIKV